MSRMRFRISTLHQRTFILVLIPTFFFLMALGWGGFVFAKKSLLTQWRETAIANLQRGAHRFDMRLEAPKDLLQRLEYSSGAGMVHLALQYTLDQLQGLDGVTKVDVSWPGGGQEMPGMGPSGRHLSGPLEISAPEYRWQHGEGGILLLSLIKGVDSSRSGYISVQVNINALVTQIARSEWWKSSTTMLIDRQGRIISRASYDGTSERSSESSFGSHDILEKLTLAAIENGEDHGTLLGGGNIPDEILGFYRLSDIPWYLVVVAPGESVLQPILQFRLYYVLLFASAILLIMLFIRIMTAKMTGSIIQLSEAAENLANGVFGPPLPVHGSDEIGELTNSFNRMTAQIKQGVELQKAMEIAREVQQNFLPSSQYVDRGISIYWSSRYSQETGGDFYDLLRFGGEKDRVGAIVGDVVGHGIGAALLMASVRAMVRARNEQPGSLAEKMTDVNRVLCRDTEATSNFVTIFCLAVDLSTRKLEWVRAGHDPALLVYPQRGESRELFGRGIAMGVDDTLVYENNVIDIGTEAQLVVIGSDGAWEAQNAAGEMFGKERLKNIILEHAAEEPGEIIEHLHTQLDLFLEGTQPHDDITFVIVKIAAAESM